MANQEDVLKAISGKEGPVSAADIAPELKTTKQAVTTILHKLKRKGLVEGGGTEWAITDTGASEAAIGAEIPTTTADVGLDELSKFKRHGQLASVDHDLITAGAELFQEGDMRSMPHFDTVMAAMAVPPTQRNRWRSLYLSFLRSSTPEEVPHRARLVSRSAPAGGGAGPRVSGGTPNFVSLGEDEDLAARIAGDIAAESVLRLARGNYGR